MYVNIHTYTCRLESIFIGYPDKRLHVPFFIDQFSNAVRITFQEIFRFIGIL